MSKHEKMTAEEKRAREELRRINKIPSVEYLFTDTEKAKDGKKHGFLYKLLKKDRRQIALGTVAYIFQCLPAWVLPLVTSDVIDLITYRPDGYVLRIVVAGIVMFLLLGLNVPATMWRSSITNNLIRKTIAQIKCAVVRKLQRLSITYHKEMEEGRIHSKFLNDIERVNGYYHTILDSLLPNLLGALISIGIAILKSPIVMLFFLAVVPLNLVLRTAFLKPINRDSRDNRIENEKLSSKLTTTLQMMTLTKAHGLVAAEEQLVNARIDSVMHVGMRLDKTNARFGSLLWAVNQMLSLVCLFFCVFLCIKNVITTGEVVLFQSLFASICSSVLALINMYPTLIYGEEAVRSISEIMQAGNVEQDEGRNEVKHLDGKVDFCNVCYHYPDEEKLVIDNFDLHVKQGERIAVVGSSGSGKSTVMNLIIGLLSPTSGRIYIDDKPLDEMSMQSYRQFLSVVPQNSILFSGSIRENITYGLDHYDEETLQQAVKDANITEFLYSLPKGLDTMVGERGDKLSGGQKQRISIARALIRNPKILILDEATSALDNVSEFHVQKAIDRLVQERTTFIVAHRLSTIRNADRIVVMENGKMVEVGTYDELIKLGGKFCELERMSRIRDDQVRDEIA